MATPYCDPVHSKLSVLSTACGLGVLLTSTTGLLHIPDLGVLILKVASIQRVLLLRLCSSTVVTARACQILFLLQQLGDHLLEVVMHNQVGEAALVEQGNVLRFLC